MVGFVAFYCSMGSCVGAYVDVDCPVGRGGGDFPLSFVKQ